MNMKQNMTELEIFRKGDDVLPALYWGMIFVEYIRPILFTCVDEYGELYICSCYLADAKSVNWMLAKTTEEAVLNLLKDKISIHDIFYQAGEYIYLIKLSAGNSEPTAVRKLICDIPSEFFPTDGYYMEAEDGEFDEEIEELQSRINERDYEIISPINEDFREFETEKTISVDMRTIEPPSIEEYPMIFSYPAEKSFIAFSQSVNTDTLELSENLMELEFYDLFSLQTIEIRLAA